MLKLPFFNRKRYVVLKAYTDAELIYHKSPVSITAKCKHNTYHPNSTKVDLKEARHRGSFQTCYGNTGSYRRSFTIPMWSEVKVRVKDGTLDILSAVQEPHFAVIPHTGDTDWNPVNKIEVMKFAVPWVFETSWDGHWVYGSHILNTTAMNIPTGILEFRNQYDANIFCKIDTSYSHEYKIPYLHPVMQCYPLTDLPFHLEVEYDPTIFHRIKQRGSQYPYFRASVQKFRAQGSTDIPVIK